MIPARIFTRFCLPALLALLVLPTCTAALRAADNAPVTDIPPAPAGSIWSVQTDSARNPAGAAQAVLRMRSSVTPEARMLLLYSADSSPWYVVELTASPDREAARQAAEAYLRISGRKAVVRQMDATLHEERTVPEALLREPQNIAQLSAANTAADPVAQASSVSTADQTPLRAEPQPASGQIDNEQSASVLVDNEQSASVLVDNEQSASVLVDNEQPASVLVDNEQPASVLVDNEQSASVLADSEQSAPMLTSVLAEDGQTAPGEAVTANAEAAVAPEQRAPYTPFNADSRQAALIIARSTFMQGDHEGARAMYRVLLTQYGPDEEIVAGYVDTLLEGRRWAEAESELAAWRVRSPQSLDAIRQTARLYLLMADENGNYEAAFPWLETILEQTPEDTDIKSDYAYARLNAGDWNGALALFSDVLDADPGNTDAAEAVRIICRDHSPQLRADFRSEVQTGNISINTLETEYSRQLNPAWRLAVSEERSSIHRKGNNQGTTGIATEILRHSVRARNDINTRWSLLSGISYFSGKAEGMGAEAGFERRDLLGGTLSLEGELNAPWLSTLDAVDREGTTDTYTARYERPLNDFWSMSASAGAVRYSLENISGYSWQEREEFALTRSIRYLPDLSASYIFTRTRQHYRQNDPAERPVDLVDKEDIHALRLEMLHWYNDYVALRAFGSAGYDVFRPSPLFGAGGGLRFRLGERIDLDAGFEYNNDTGQVGGGEAKALTSSIIFRF
ncbi:tetratricopeptide repeat protein [Desulfovibrio subterraneus]|uniref:SPOR domain-containing protein n=1 Tax=Desulfovibrio subterraneus TaxID=2718620 RepID=A0A7J0BH10_9BACT|nr:tetratricopeptide repeat protein [Desulfovibrio subterraneus]GFM33033.1 hypothetical protein DSM101010T_13980 [Desulfovibrio subterraneus]